MRGAIIISAVVSSLLSIVGTLVSVTWIAPTVAEAQANRIRAEEIVVEDAQGVRRLRMGTGAGVIASYSVFDGDDPRIVLGVGGPAALGGTQPLNAELRVIHPGRSGQEILATGRPQPAVLVGTDANGLPHVRLLDPAVRERVVIALDDDGNPSIRLLEPDGNVIWQAP
jgi:hypothetical protein